MAEGSSDDEEMDALLAGLAAGPPPPGIPAALAEALVEDAVLEAEEAARLAQVAAVAERWDAEDALRGRARPRPRARPARAGLGGLVGAVVPPGPAAAGGVVGFVVPPGGPAAGRRHRRGIREGAFDREAEGVVPTDGLPWAEAAHTFWAPRLLTEADPRAGCPPGFKGDLYAPQRTLLAAMLALERRPLLRVEDPRAGEGWAPQLQTRCARVSERFSFGKTVTALALVCAQRVPARLPELTPLLTYALQGTAGLHTNRASVTSDPAGGTYDSVGRGFLPEVTVRYRRFLPLTVVAAASNVISQWEENTTRFTALKYFIVENVHSLRAFEQLYREGGADSLDLVFVKAGRVTTSFVVAGEPPPAGPPVGHDANGHRTGAKNRSMFQALARILEGVTVARLVVDDFDTLKLGGDDCLVPALFTWLVSATRRQTSARVTVNEAHLTVEAFFRANAVTAFPIAGAALDDILNKTFSLHCAPEYVDAHLQSTRITYRRIYTKGGLAAQMLRDLDVAAEVVEMVNADAIGTAVRTLGLEAATVGDVIRHVVGGHLDKLRGAVRALTNVAAAREALGRKGGRETDRETVKALRAALKDGSDEEVAAAIEGAAGMGPAVAAALDSLTEWADKEREAHSKALSRMRDNIREGHCQCCMVPFGEEGGAPGAAYVLVGCCQVIVCELCIVRKEGKAKRFIPRCPNCAQGIRLEAEKGQGPGLIRVGAEVDLEAALRDEALEAALAAAPPGAPGEGPGPEAPPPAAPLLAGNPKLAALVQLLRGEAIGCLRDEVTPPYVAGLLDGRRDAPWPAARPRKYLVFTMHAESTAEIRNCLAASGVPHCTLRGTRAQKDAVVAEFRAAARVMLVTSAGDCGGINLPFISHVVFYHLILDKNVEAQVAARGQRLGREHNLEVVTLVNEAEAMDLA
jgi:hypothetical protein